VFVKIQTDHVDGAPAPGNGDFHAVNKADIVLLRCRACGGQTARVVVVGEREHGTAVFRGQRHHFFGRQRTV